MLYVDFIVFYHNKKKKKVHGMWGKQRGVYPTGVNSEQEGFQK